MIKLLKSISFLSNKNDELKSLITKSLNIWYVLFLVIMFPIREIAWSTSASSNLPVNFYTIIMGAGFLSAMKQIFFQRSFLFSVFTYISFQYLYRHSGPFLDGGDNLMSLLLFYNMIVNSDQLSPAFNFFSNLGIMSGKLQIALVYLVAGLTKVTGHLWTTGTALYYALNVDIFTHPLMKDFVNTNVLISTIGSYSILLFQISFPFMVWNSKLKRIYLLAGTFLHLGILFGMGLTTFGCAMIISYFAFYSNQEAKLILTRLEKLLNTRINLLTLLGKEKHGIN